MAHGGARKGAGRPKGTISAPSKKLLREIADKVATDDKVTPLEVMIEVMRFHWDVVESANSKKDYAAKIAAMSAAVSVAEKVAPYIHPRLASTELKGDPNKPLIKPDVKVVLVGANNGNKPKHP